MVRLLDVARGVWRLAEVGVPSVGESPEPGVLAPGKVAVAAVLIMAMAFLTTVLLPGPRLLRRRAEPAGDLDSRLRRVRRRRGAAAGGRALARLGLDPVRVAEGREIYIAEGCVHCHTQQVRANVTDVGLGAVTTRDDVTLSSPALLGRLRLGPDLAHAGQRPLTDDLAWVVRHLPDPRADRAWSSMPSYDYLTDDELDALAQYIVSLQ